MLVQAPTHRESPMARHLISFLVVVAGGSYTTSAAAYTTRVHISLANDVREALIASGGGRVQLLWSGDSVVIPEDDATAIINQPLAFRAGSIGPDNFVFPAMTDGTHALGQNPFGMCELLYLEAITEEERAYALGCFLHGTGDAIAHHAVNLFTGETFTFTPTRAGRTTTLFNIAGHIVTESIIQQAFLDADPERFATGPLSHAIPAGFIGRTIHNPESRVWQLLAREPRERFERVRAADPSLSLFEAIARTELGPWEYLALAPLFVDELQQEREELRAFIESEIADLQDPSSERGARLGVGAGDDGILGTTDDETACSASCGATFARYRVFVAILQPRRSASGVELPSAYDALSDDLARRLNAFLPALTQSIGRLSAILNSPLSAEDDGSEFAISGPAIADAIQPMLDWARDVGAIDYALIASALTPDWYEQIENALSSVGVDIRVANLIETIFQPVVDGVIEVIRTRVIDQAEEYLGSVVDEIEMTEADWKRRIDDILIDEFPQGFSAGPMDNILETGLYAYTFNFSVATLANHNLVLAADEIATGPASFDASYTYHWTQAGLCDYLQPSIFPEGTSVEALLSLRIEGMYVPAGATQDTPVECHDGSLSEFGEPSVTACAVVEEEVLQATRVGSVSRSYPPLWAAVMPRCLNIAVPGLPDPPTPPRPDAGPGSDSGTSSDAGTVPDSTTGFDGGEGMGEGGCACRAAPSGTSSAPLWLGLFVWMAWARRRTSRRILLAMSVLVCVGCSEDMLTSDSGLPDAGTSDVSTFFDSGDMGDGAPDASSTDTGPAPADMGVSDGRLPGQMLLAEIGNSTWNAAVRLNEGDRMVERALEMRFRAASLEWATIRNPYGPARLRDLRSMRVLDDGFTVETTILSPSGWPANPRNGLRETWTIEVVGDTGARTLFLRNVDTSEEFEFDEGAWPAPDTGLTAELRVFASTGTAWDAFCGAGINLDDIERRAAWEFARGRSTETPRDYDVVAGARLTRWNDSALDANDFSAIDVDGFGRLGGTEVSTQFNFMVRYTGTVRHPGGLFEVREEDDSLEDAVWTFVGDDVGAVSVTQLLHESHNWFNADATPDIGSVSLAAGDVPIEIILVRCSMPFGGKDVHVQARLGSGEWTTVGDLDSLPILSSELFPPAL